MQTRRLGNLTVSAIGLGCMGMSEFYGQREPADYPAVLAAAVDIGITFWDSADIYGQGDNERLLGAFFHQHPAARQRVQLASKCGIVRDARGEFIGLNGRPEYIRAACDASLQRLGVEHLDLYYLHRVDPQVPVEDSIGVMAELVQAGKVRHLGLSEVSVATLQRAHRVHAITALQSEYSLWSREVEAEILPLCATLGIGFVPYSPLGRGFLTGAFRQRDDLSADDWRRHAPRFADEHFAANRQLVEQVEALARDKGYTSAQLALAWLLAQSPSIVPIPGMRSVARLSENAASVALTLTPAERDALAQALQPVQGARYPAAMLALLAAESPVRV